MEMAGTRNRCFYCSDSAGADVDHYKPISIDHTQTFVWPNLLWVCPVCNRKKLASFPMVDGEPAIIDPTQIDPWRHLALDQATGILAPRFHGEWEDERGRQTLKVIDRLNYEDVAEGRRRTMRRLERAAVAALAAEDDAPSEADALWREVDEDDYGVAAWFALWEGQRMTPFAEIRSRKPTIWRHFVRAVAASRAA
jgi:hypothetical protein